MTTSRPLGKPWLCDDARPRLPATRRPGWRKHWILRTSCSNLLEGGRSSVLGGLNRLHPPGCHRIAETAARSSAGDPGDVLLGSLARLGTGLALCSQQARHRRLVPQALPMTQQDRPMLGSSNSQYLFGWPKLGRTDHCECVVQRAALIQVATLKFGAACYEICRMFP